MAFSKKPLLQNVLSVWFNVFLENNYLFVFVIQYFPKYMFFNVSFFNFSLSKEHTEN